MAQGMIHRLLAVFMDAAKGMGIRCECSDVERMAVLVHRVMSYQSRQFHTLEHVFGFLPGADHETALAAAFHDLVYYQVDDGLPPDLEGIVGPYIRKGDGGIRLAAAGAAPADDMPYADTLAVFGFTPGQELQPFSGLNEFLSALVMMKALERHLPRPTRIAIAACIEASIPFRGPDAGGRGVGDLLAARIGAMAGIDGVDAAIHRAIAFSNHDIRDFTLPDSGLFLSNTWKLLPESNATLRGKGGFRIREYRVALGKMLGFFRSLRPDRICHSYRGVPDEAAMRRLEDACRRNLGCAQAYLQAKLLAVGVLEAAADVSGGDAPMALFMGDLPQRNEDGEGLATFLPAAPVPPWIDGSDPVYRLLKDGRLEESDFDLKNSPLALHLRHRLPPAAWEAGLAASEDFFSGRISAEKHLLGFEAKLRADILTACARIVPTRKDVLTAWIRAHPGA